MKSSRFAVLLVLLALAAETPTAAQVRVVPPEPAPLPRAVEDDPLPLPREEPEDREKKQEKKNGPGGKEPEISLALPSPDQLFAPLESEAQALQRLRLEAERRGIQLQFPTQPQQIEAGVWPARSPTPLSVAPVSAAFCYSPLYFEDRNTERYGWNVPCVQPLLSTGRFYAQLLCLPHSLFVQPPWTKQCVSEQSAPGDATPYFLHLDLLGRSGTHLP